MIHICGYTANSSLVKFDKSFLENHNIPIPDDAEFGDDTLTFHTSYDAKKWVRKNAESIPRDIKAIQLYSTFIDHISKGKQKWTCTGKYLHSTLIMSDYREFQVIHTHQGSRKNNEETDEDFDAEDGFLDD